MLIAILDALKPALLGLLPVLVAVWLGYRLGVVGYLGRKEHEKIIQRYLEGGIDLIASNTDHALSIFRENWAHSLRLLREFKGTAEVGLPFRRESLQKEFLKYETSSFSVTPFYRVKSMVGNDIFWDACQLLFAFVSSAYDFFENDLKLALQAYSEGRIEISSPQQFFDEYLGKVRQLNEEANRFYSILKELQNIAIYVETKPIDFKTLERLKELSEIKQCVDTLKSVFETEKQELANKLPQEELHRLER